MSRRKSVALKGNFDERDIKSLKKYEHIESLSLTELDLLTAKIAKGMRGLQSVQSLWIWASVTRTAMREVVKIPNLEVLDILEIRHPGKLENLSVAHSLKVFRCNHYMSEDDLMAIAQLPLLEELGAQNAVLTSGNLAALLRMPNLSALDLEGTNFNDEMAAMMSQAEMSNAEKIKSLDVGGTRLTGKGLEQLCQMKQLESLDLWETPIPIDEKWGLCTNCLN